MRSSSDFNFWDEEFQQNHASYDESGGTHVEFQAQRFSEDHFNVSSPPLWTRVSRNFRYEASPLIKYEHQNRNCLSPSSRLKAITNGTREVMEMIKDLPEASFELSLKDIVDHKESMEEMKNKQDLAKEGNFKHKTEAKVQKKSKSNLARRQICRSESMESGVFLLKMFIPVSLSFRKKSEARNGTKESHGTLKGFEKQLFSKDWWKTMFIATKDGNKNHCKISRSASDTGSSKSSLIKRNFRPRERSFSRSKSESRGIKGCLF